MVRNLEEIKLSTEELRLIEKGWNADAAYNIHVNKFLYNSDKEIVRGYSAYPKDINANLPIIIWNRGGNDKSGLLDDFLATGILGEIASWGYAVFASQYRENDGFGGSDVNDVLNLIDVARKSDLSDENKIGMEGWSRGGMMTYLALTKTNEIKSAVIIAGLSDLQRNSKNKKLEEVYRKHFGGDDPLEFEKQIISRSAVKRAEKISCKTNILFIHGTADEKISAEDSKEMYSKLSGINVTTKYELKLIEGGDHYLRNNKKEVSLLRKNWFESNLKFNS
jgi:dipeptidyl aminopeptidase/acylaminoacyl peptidase